MAEANLSCAVGMARMTASMVRMGLLWLVHDIVVHLCEHERSDAVAGVTVGLLQLYEMDIVMQINNSLVESGHIQQAAQIAGPALSNIWAGTRLPVAIESCSCALVAECRHSLDCLSTASDSGSLSGPCLCTQACT